MKRCSQCKKVYPIAAFYKDSSKANPDFRDCRCRFCRCAKAKSYYEKNKERIKAKNKERRIQKHKQKVMEQSNG